MPSKTKGRLGETDPSTVMSADKNKAQLFQVFQNVQFNVVQHKKYVKELTKLYKKIGETEFREMFAQALYHLFTFGDSSPAVDRVVQFVAMFCTSLDDEEEFLRFVFQIIFDCQKVAGQSVRYRSSQLLAAVLTALGEDASLDDDLCDELLSSQMERLQDTRGAVRCRAALALQRLQNPNEPDDPVTTSYRFHMSCDPSPSVRRAIVMSIAKCTRNLPYVLERLCDTDEAVRRAAFIYVAAINVTQLKVRQRVHVLKVGLTERSTRVRRVVEEILLPSWLSTFKGNIVDLLTAVRLDNATGAKDSQYVAGKLLESLFKRLPMSELLEWLPTDRTLRVIPAEKLGKETAWYWRHLAEHLLHIDDEETLEAVLPDLVVMVGYMRAIVESPCPDEQLDPVGFGTRQYVLHELAVMLRCYDGGDEVGRASLQQLLMDILTGDHGPLAEDTIRALVSALEMVLPDVNQRTEFVVSVITELREPAEAEVAPAAPAAPVECTESKLQRARLRVSLNVAMEAQEEAVREQNYALASECKGKVERIQRQLDELARQNEPAPPPPPPVQAPREKSNDPAVLNRYLQILNMALDTKQITTVTPMLKVLFEELEEEIFRNPNVLENAIKTVAMYGLLDAEFAKEHKAFFFTNIIDLTNESIVCTVLRCICDLLCVHGARLFEDDQVSKAASMQPEELDESDLSILISPSHGTVVEVMLKAMDSQCSSYRLIVVEGLCRLLMLSHLESVSILSRLLLLWFSPATEDEDLLRQTIGVFFQSFAVSVDGAQDQIQKATLPTLKALANAPVHSPLAEIDHDAVIRFIVSLTRVQQETSDSQGSMALLLVNTLVAEKTKPVSGLLCKCLAQLQPPRDLQLATDLAATLRTLIPDLPDKTSARCVARYLGGLENMEKTACTTKMSTMGGTMATINEESTNETQDSETRNSDTGIIGRATSSIAGHKPLARSTHVGGHTLHEAEKEIEIDETSPENQTANTPGLHTPQPARPRSNNRRLDRSKASTDSNSSDKYNAEERRYSDGDRRVTLVRGSRIPEYESPPLRLSSDNEIPDTQEQDNRASESSDGASPKKQPRKGGKAAAKSSQNAANKNKASQESRRSGEDGEKGIKRTRSQRSIVDLSRVSTGDSPSTPVTSSKSTTPTDTPEPIKTKKTSKKSAKKKIAELGTPVRRSPRSSISRSSSESATSGKSSKSAASSGSKGKKKAPPPAEKTGKTSTKQVATAKRARSSVGVRSDDSADETQLHTIIYDREMVQSLMPDSSDDEANQSERGNITIPETPESSERSLSSSPDMVGATAKGRKK